MLRFKDLMERINIAKTKMGDVIKDFQDSDAPQFKGKSAEKRRQMAIAAKLEADRGVKEEVEDLDEVSTNLAIRARSKALSDTSGKDRSKLAKLALDKWSGKAKVGSGKYNTYEEVEDLEEGSHKDGETRMGSVGPITTDAERAERAKKYREKKMKKEEVEQTDEELKGKQHKIDANKNGKIDGHDFKILRNAKKARYQ